MVTLREQTQKLVQEIQRLREARKESQAKRRKAWSRAQTMRQRVRNAENQEIQEERKRASQDRLAFTRGLRQSVKRTLKCYRTQRVQLASHRKQSAEHSGKILRRNLLQTLQENQHQRARSRAAFQRRQLKTRHEMKLQVQKIRGDVNKLLSGLSSDLQMARAAWGQANLVRPENLLGQKKTVLPKS